ADGLSPVDLRFCVVGPGLGAVAFWLREGDGDGGGEQVEGLALGGGRDGEGGDDGVGGLVAVADVVAGEGGQVGEQATEAVVGLVVFGGVGAGVAGRRGGALGAGDGVFAGGWLLVGVGERGHGAAQVPGEVFGEHAD